MSDRRMSFGHDTPPAEANPFAREILENTAFSTKPKAVDRDIFCQGRCQHQASTRASPITDIVFREYFPGLIYGLSVRQFTTSGGTVESDGETVIQSTLLGDY